MKENEIPKGTKGAAKSGVTMASYESFSNCNSGNIFDVDINISLRCMKTN